MTQQILHGAAAIAEGEANAFFRVPRQRPDHNARLIEAAQIMRGVESGSYRALANLQEAMATSDFPVYLAAILDRELLPAYQDITPLWTQFARRTTLRDFRPKKFVDLLGGRGLLSRVGQLEPYPARALEEQEYQISVGKYGTRFHMSFEDFVNDDLGDFRSLPQRLATAATDTEDYLAAAMLASESGPNSNLFRTRTKSATTPNPISNAAVPLPLNIDNLGTAITTITSRRDVDGRPIAFPKLVLMVPPALEIVANTILNAATIEVTIADKKVTVTNWLSSKLTVVVNPWLSVIDKSAKSGATWYIVPEPSAPRLALAFGFLRGHETPELRVKNDTGTRVDGGSIDPTEGSFDDDSIQYRCRHVMGAATLDPIGTFASTGS